MAYLLPAVFVGAAYGVTHYLYMENGFDASFIYGDINNEGEM